MAGNEAIARPKSLRHEIKMVCQEAAHGEILTRLRLDSASVQRLHPRRRVQSLYLDTTFGRALAENLSGLSHREKLRVRWYGPETRGVRARIECKVRENQLGWKETTELEEPLDVEGVDRNAFVRTLCRSVTPEWRHRLDAGLEPVQWISYQRDYYTTPDRRVRITIDRELRATDQRHRFKLSRSRPTRLPRLLVIEAKCGQEHLDHARRLLGQLPVFVDRCSKFVLASDADHGPTPAVLPL